MREDDAADSRLLLADRAEMLEEIVCDFTNARVYVGRLMVGRYLMKKS
jgi:hypothetical protein